MKRRELLASTITPDGMRMTLSLHAGDYYIDVDGRALMSTRAPGSEKALADLAAQELTDNTHPRVLIGGLGLGFTLGAALDVLPRGRRWWWSNSSRRSSTGIASSVLSRRPLDSPIHGWS